MKKLTERLEEELPVYEHIDNHRSLWWLNEQHHGTQDEERLPDRPMDCYFAMRERYREMRRMGQWIQVGFWSIMALIVGSFIILICSTVFWTTNATGMTSVISALVASTLCQLVNGRRKQAAVYCNEAIENMLKVNWVTASFVSDLKKFVSLVNEIKYPECTSMLVSFLTGLEADIHEVSNPYYMPGHTKAQCYKVLRSGAFKARATQHQARENPHHALLINANLKKNKADLKSTGDLFRDFGYRDKRLSEIYSDVESAVPIPMSDAAPLGKK